MKNLVMPGTWLFCAALFAALTARAELVFDNSQTYLGKFSTNLVEYGDEVILGGSARTITTFQFEYYGDFLRTGDETARIRFYKNDGPGQYASPGTLLFDSGLFPIFSGLNTVPISGISVEVPKDFTWTIEFSGLTGESGDQAGLLFYDPPTVGKSFNDYWKKEATGWNLYSFPTFKANYGARIFASPDPALVITATNHLADGSYQLNLSGPIGETIVIQRSVDLVNWTPVGTNTFSAEPLTFVDSQTAGLTDPSYRAIPAPEVFQIDSQKRLSDGKIELKVLAAAGRKVVVDGSSDLTTWTPVGTNTVSFLAAPITFTDSSATNYAFRFYRARLAP
ncbi:MAG: hypothetical protein HY043_12210 [Verrucomicrobia bacterium]|nr:hypothetical protein [Verrucomicrobiota bacterium]